MANRDLKSLRMNELMEYLRSELAQLGTSEVIGWMATTFVRTAIDPLYMSRELGFTSQQRQSAYMLSVLMATPESDRPEALTDERQAHLVEILNEIEIRYIDPYLGSAAPETAREHSVAFGAFVQFFMSGRLSYVHQIIERMESIDRHFDEAVADALGVSVSAVLANFQFIIESMQKRWDDSMEAGMLLEKSRREVLERVVEHGASMEDEFKKLQDDCNIQDALQTFGSYFPISFKASDLREAFPEHADAFLAAFSLKRGQVRELPFYADADGSPVENAPLLWIDDDTVCCPFRAALYESIESRIGRTIASSTSGPSYSERRGKYLEQKSLEVLASLLPTDALRIATYYERADSQFEHDGLIFWDGKLILIEAKSSDMPEPSRTPERAFQHVSRHFKSNRGIQHGYGQAVRVVNLIREGKGPLILYAQDGHELARIDREAVREIHIVCTTMESFGPLAADLTLLLDKPEDQRFPVAFNVFDLETLINGFKKRGLGPSDLLSYLTQREDTMGKVTSGDELDFAGTYLRDGTLPRSGETPILLVSGSEIFDDLYFEEMGAARAAHTSMSAMATRDLERLRDRSSHLGANRQNSPKIERNSPCPCGSGKKYKKCHGLPGLSPTT